MHIYVYIHMRVCVFVFLSAQWAVDVNLRALLVVQMCRVPDVELPVCFSPAHLCISPSPLSSLHSPPLSLCESTDSKRMSITMGQ